MNEIPRRVLLGAAVLPGSSCSRSQDLREALQHNYLLCSRVTLSL
jgi:hypothetical protein